MHGEQLTDPDTGVQWIIDRRTRLGRGGYGQVFAGVSDSGVDVAIKQILVDDRDLDRALLREGEIATVIRAATSSTDHLMRPHSAIFHDKSLYIVMPRAARSLEDYLKSGPVDRPLAVNILMDITRGLQELQILGVIHRDLKPANILEINSHWVLSDFGLSRDLAALTASHSLHGLGTPAYMAPEVWKLDPKTTKSDFYSLGIILHELVSGKAPFVGPASDDYRNQHLNLTPPDLPDGVPPVFRRLATRLLSKSPHERPQDARAVLEMLERSTAPLSASQNELASAAAAQSQRASEAEARTAQANAHTQFLDDFRVQAGADLIGILSEAEEGAQAADPEAKLWDDGAQIHLGLGRAIVTFVIWPWTSHAALSNKLEGTHVLFGGAVYTSLTRAEPDANIAFVFNAQSKRASWVVQRFNHSGSDGPRGHDQRTYPPIIEERETAYVVTMRHYVTNDVPLTPDEALRLLTDAVNALE
ncbi:hypothetical protein ASG84_25775 [Rhodococcus sp. Leaf278]|uniref:serine/threonine-protein kinase n=1 Tax=Rhodococcus sp. Leaf278 TaxID=1736319 RepID=UPI00070B5A6E|nr:serine/threonine-protein kinase [Rhodococcus sp. Leaf278]KQU51510.1 hypothetical protein ASG84_25775 [Rhodococcus sp. Leaf278]